MVSLDDLVGGVFGVFFDAANLAVDGLEYAVENPGKALAITAAGVATGGVAYACAAPIAAGLGSMGALGAASTGTAISTLEGAALVNASLASLGGGALAAGGGGMAAGAATVGVVGAGVGTAVGATTAGVLGGTAELKSA